MKVDYVSHFNRCMNTNVIERAKQTAKNANIYLLDMNEVVGTPERPTYKKVTPEDGPPIYSVRDTRSMMIVMMGIAHENERGFAEANRLRIAQRNLDGAVRNLDEQTRRVSNTSPMVDVSPIQYVSASGVTHSLPRDNMDMGDIDILDALDDDGEAITWSDQEDEEFEPGRTSSASTPLVPSDSDEESENVPSGSKHGVAKNVGGAGKRRKMTSDCESTPAENDIIVEEVMQVGSEIYLYRFEEKIFQTWGISGPFG